MNARIPLAAALVCLYAGCSSSSSGEGRPIPADRMEYVVLAWNDLGMHCLNPTYDQAVILPPYNTLWAQVVRRGDPPEIVTAGLTVEYRIVGNTFSYGKRRYGEFWDFSAALFGASPAPDHGLNLVDPAISNGLSGAMVAFADHFQVDGIPLVPVDDQGAWNPFQVAEITVKDASGAVLVRTQATVPTSDEIDCARCHGATGEDTFARILATHDAEEGTRLAAGAPVLCASCHASPALGTMARTGGHGFLSEVIHAFHGAIDPALRPTCYDCHPGEQTRCNRSLAHSAADGNCTDCHGTLSQVGSSVTAGRVPWVKEPACADCHAGVPEVDTGAALYRNAAGHGGIRCAACHGSPHAMVPSRVASDHAQAVQYQGAALPLSSCRVCHETSRGGGSSVEFQEEHGGPNPEVRSACAVCHTSVSGPATDWPHRFGWKAR